MKDIATRSTAMRAEFASRLSDISILPFVSALISRLSIYVILVVAARLLDGEAFGAYALCLVAVGILAALVSGGGDMWLNRFTGASATAEGQAPRLWPIYFAVVGFISMFSMAAAIVLHVKIAMPDGFSLVILLTAASAVAVGMVEAVLAVARAGGAVRLFFVSRDIALPLMYLAFLIWLEPRTVEFAMAIYLAMWGTALLVSLLLLLRHAPAMLPAVLPSKAAWRPAVQHTLGLIYGNLTSRLATHVDVLMLTAVASLTDVGEYRVAAQFAIGFMVIQHFVFLGLPWQLRRKQHGAENAKGHDLVLQRQKILLSIAALGGGIVWMAAGPLFTLLGERFEHVVPIFRVLLLTRFISLLWGPQHEMLISNGLQDQDAHANVFSLVVWLPIFAALMTWVNALNAAVAATILATVAAHLFRLVVLRRNRIPEVYGHPLGPGAPIALSLLTLASIGWWAD